MSLSAGLLVSVALSGLYWAQEAFFASTAPGCICPQRPRMPLHLLHAMNSQASGGHPKTGSAYWAGVNEEDIRSCAVATGCVMVEGFVGRFGRGRAFAHQMELKA